MADIGFMLHFFIPTRQKYLHKGPPRDFLMSQGSSNNCWCVMRSVTAICLQTPTGSGLYLFLIGSAFYSQTPLVVVLLHKMSVEI